jgi:hypothetical protein
MPNIPLVRRAFCDVSDYDETAACNVILVFGGALWFAMNEGRDRFVRCNATVNLAGKASTFGPSEFGISVHSSESPYRQVVVQADDGEIEAPPIENNYLDIQSSWIEVAGRRVYASIYDEEEARSNVARLPRDEPIASLLSKLAAGAAAIITVLLRSGEELTFALPPLGGGDRQYIVDNLAMWRASERR